MTRITQINPFALARLLALIMTLFGLGAGLLYAFGGLVYDLLTIGLNRGTMLAFLALIGMPILFGVGGFLLGLFGGFLYNVCGRLA